MAYSLYSIPYEKHYCAHPLAPASLVCYCTYFLVAIIPFLLVASTQNLWILQVEGVEQIDMNFKNNNNFHITILAKNIATQVYSTYTVSNMINQQNQNNPDDIINLASLTHKDIDFNQDGKSDQLEISINVIPTKEYQIIDVEAVIFMNMSFREFTKIDSVGMLRFKTNNIAQIPIGSAVFAGQPKLKINKPLPRSKQTILQIYNTNPFHSGWMLIDKIYEQYYQRDFRIEADYQTHLTQYQEYIPSTVNINILLELDKQQQILYKPSFFHLIRDAWVQYFALLLPAIIFGQIFLGYLYKYKFFSTYLQDNLPKDNKLY